MYNSVHYNESVIWHTVSFIEKNVIPKRNNIKPQTVFS